MSLMEICPTMFQSMMSVWNCFVSFESSLPDGIACSISVNSVLLAIVLMGAVGLVAPFDLKGWFASHQNRMGRS